MARKKMQPKQLREPTKSEWKNLPNSATEARKKGINRYFKDGELWELRRSNTPTYPQGKPERVSSRRSNRGNLQRRAQLADKSISLEEYIAIAKEHGYSEAQATKHYKINEAKLKKLQGKTRTFEGTPLDYEHYLPNASKAYGGIEHWRNIGPLGKDANSQKSDLLITRKTAKKSGIPLTKEEAVLMDLRGDKAVARGKIRKNIEADLTSRKPVTARLRNKYVSSRQAPSKLKLKVNKNGNGNGNGNGHNGKNGKNGKLNGIATGTGKARLVDSALQIGSNIATGNYAGAAIGAGTLAGTQALRHSSVQKTVAKQITKLIAERGAKSAAKLVPGLDIALSGKESWDYLRQGKLDQAGIAALSGAIGWLPLVGDGISAALDLSNTGLDIARLQVPNKRSRRKLKIKT